MSNARLLIVRDPVQVPAQDDVDEMLYVVAGEARLKLGEKEEQIQSGWFSVVPRGTPHVLTRRGRNPAVLLSITGGPPCKPSTAQ
jgi:mannose-6-phosphate isomerase-like protein (cupin superfamily)